MKIEKKEKFTFISVDENTFEEFNQSFSTIIPTLKNEHLVLEISDEIEVNKEDFLLYLSIAEQKKGRWHIFCNC